MAKVSAKITQVLDFSSLQILKLFSYNSYLLLLILRIFEYINNSEATTT